MLANLYIAGCMRAGTTSLYKYLARHPEVWMAGVKEPHHLAMEPGRRAFCGPGDAGFERELVVRRDRYEALFAGAQGRLLRGEASSQYFQNPRALERMAALTPRARVVVVLRDPVDRAHSAWAYLHGQGRETAPTLLEGIAREEERRRAGYSPMWSYVAASRYAAAAEQLLALFGDRAVVLRYEDLRADPRAFMDALGRRLGLDSHLTRTHVDTAVVHNRARPRRRSVAALPSRLPVRQRQAVRRALPSAAVAWLERLRERPGRGEDGPGPDVRAELAPLFTTDIARTAEVTGLDLSRWPTAMR